MILNGYYHNWKNKFGQNNGKFSNKGNHENVSFRDITIQLFNYLKNKSEKDMILISNRECLFISFI